NHDALDHLRFLQIPSDLRWRTIAPHTRESIFGPAGSTVGPSGGATMIEDTLDIQTRAGAMETFVCRPDRGTHPAVLLLMDAPGIREELRAMARRLTSVGYAVLLPNLYYRAGRDSKCDPATVLPHASPEHTRMRAIR